MFLNYKRMEEVGFKCMTPFVTLDTYANYLKKFPEKRIVLAYQNNIPNDSCGFWVLSKKEWKKFQENKVGLSFNVHEKGYIDLYGKPISTTHVQSCPVPRWGFRNMKEFKVFIKNVEKEIENAPCNE